MPVRIRLQRHGKKGKPFYWIVAADSRAKRDGKFLEKLGTYNPNTNPAQIELDVDGSVKWLQNGAQPSETARRILSYRGVLLKHHLLRGVAKGALTEAQVEEKFQTWLAEKDQKIENKKDHLAKADAEARAKALEAEKEVREKRKAVAEEPEAADIAEEKAEMTAEAEAPVEAAKQTAEDTTSEADTKEEKAATETPAKATAKEEITTEAAPEKSGEKPEEVREENKAAEAPAKEAEKTDEAAAPEAVAEKTGEDADATKAKEDKAPEA